MTAGRTGETGPGGSLRIEASWNGEGIGRLAVRSTRPRAARLLAGRGVGEALRLVPALFSLCGHAQGAAAAAALAAAGAPDMEAADSEAVERALAAEMAQEHLWRLLLDWPALFGDAPRRERFAALHRRLGRLVDAEAAFELGGELLDLVAVELLAGFFDSMREPQGLAEFVARAQRGGSIGAVLAQLIGMEPRASEAQQAPLPFLPPLPASAWAARLEGGLPSPAFQAAPVLEGRPHETGPLARHAGSPLVRALLAHRRPMAARLFARVVDLADCASRLRHPLAADVPPLVDAAAQGDAGGLACVETARGVLIHAVRLEGDRIADYGIVAPTEWNFHPDGAFAREARALKAASPEAARRYLAALVLSLDPCVPCEIRLEEETAHA